VDQIQNVMSKNNNGQSSVLSLVFNNALEFRAAYDVNKKEKHAQPSQAKAERKDKIVAHMQLAMVHSPMQPGSFMASVRGLPSGPTKMPQKRFKIEIVEEQQWEDMQVVQVRKNNDVIVLKINHVLRVMMSRRVLLTRLARKNESCQLELSGPRIPKSSSQTQIPCSVL